jgi:putative SOS response-associated peptidase YedK
MCARFTLMMPWRDLVRLLGAGASVDGSPSWNVAPTHVVPAVQESEAGRRLLGARWGLVAPWSSKPLINARAETAAEKPVFRTALRERRCLIPTTGFYEWRTEDGRKRPYLFRRADGAPFVFAGILDSCPTEEGPSPAFAILTTGASAFVRQFHERMPVILDASAWDSWLDRSVTDPAAVSHLLRPAPSDLLVAVPVSPRVNNPRNNDAACAAPTGPPVVPSLGS